MEAPGEPVTFGPMSETRNRFLRDVHIIARLVNQTFEEGYLSRVSVEGLTFDQLNLLKFLGQPKTLMVKDVTYFLDASYAAASKAVARLERKGLVRKTTLGSDRRAEIIELTPKARGIVRRYEKLKADRVSALLEGQDVDGLCTHLEKTIELLLKERAVAGYPCLGCGAYYTKNCFIRAHGLPSRCQE